MITKVNTKDIFTSPKINKRRRKYNNSVTKETPKLHTYIVGMYEDGVPLKEIGKHFGKSVRYVKKTILKYRTCIVRIAVNCNYETPKLNEPDLLVCGVMFLKAINDKTLNEFFTKVHDVNSITTSYAVSLVPIKAETDWWLVVD